MNTSLVFAEISVDNVHCVWQTRLQCIFTCLYVSEIYLKSKKTKQNLNLIQIYCNRPLSETFQHSKTSPGKKTKQKHISWCDDKNYSLSPVVSRCCVQEANAAARSRGATLLLRRDLFSPLRELNWLYLKCCKLNYFLRVKEPEVELCSEIAEFISVVKY